MIKINKLKEERRKGVGGVALSVITDTKTCASDE